MRALTCSRATLLMSVLALTASACYRQIPSEGGAPAVGRELVLELSPRGAIELAPQLGAQLRSVTGQVTDFQYNAYRVSISQTNSTSGIETLWRGEAASIPRDFVVSVSERELDKGRSWIVGGLSALGVALVGRSFGLGSNGGVFGRGGGTRQ